MIGLVDIRGAGIMIGRASVHDYARARSTGNVRICGIRPDLAAGHPNQGRCPLLPLIALAARSAWLPGYGFKKRGSLLGRFQHQVVPVGKLVGLPAGGGREVERCLQAGQRRLGVVDV
ncbi:MAG: hypothetical protein WCC71_23685, partial [Candidatus Sulfotelmatobacter sp.]